MEIIRKRICLEDFKSRIPATIKTYSFSDKNKGSWDEIPYRLKIFVEDGVGDEVIKRYGTVINLYYLLFNGVRNAKYYKWDGFKWCRLQDYDWRNVLIIKYPYITMEQDSLGEEETEATEKVDFYVDLPDATNTPDNTIIGLLNSDVYSSFNGIFGTDKNGLEFINEIHNIIGLYLIPIEYDGEFVPYIVYHNEIEDLIKDIKEVKKYSIQCKNSKFQKYSGDDFLHYLELLNNIKTPIYGDKIETTIDIPILLTGNTVDLGMYKNDDIDVILEGEENKNINHEGECDKGEDYIKNSYLVKTSGESRLKSLRRRKVSVNEETGEELEYILDKDENGNVIYEKYKINGINVLSNGYKIGYIKNIQMYDGNFFGDYISSIEYKDDGKVKFIYVLGEKLQQDSETKLKVDKTIKSPWDDDFNEKEWNGYGVWYCEEFNYEIKQTKNDGPYISIKFSEKEMTYDYVGIDFPRKNYILCEEIVYRTETYRDNIEDCDPLYRDEKMMGLSIPMNEKYDVIIDRGSSAAFERHLQLTEVKTWQDLENYRNGMFLNK